MKMIQINTGKIAAQLSEHYGLPLLAISGHEENSYAHIILHPDGVHTAEGFSVKLSLGWRSIKGEFEPGAYAAPMIREMGISRETDKSIFKGLIGRILEENGKVNMRVNLDKVDPVKPETWPENWERLSLEFEKSPLAVNTENICDTENAVFHWGGRFLAAILALAPLEESEMTENENPEGLPEGAKSTVEVNKYERNRFNRAACIEIRGTSCIVCGFNFEEIYGELGKGYIHVHHIVPVSQIGENYRINPILDLVPVCPNCHAMLHKENPPLSIDTLIEMRK